MRVLKGHGTENDFVVVPDLAGTVALPPGLVRALCDRHAGIGGDGVLRIVRSENEPEARAMASQAPFFMDYRNADGSLAEMCGNGVRVVLRYLQEAGLVDADDDVSVATRGGIVRVRAGADGTVTVNLGPPRVLSDRPVVTAAPLGALAASASVLMPNPHVVVPVSDAAGLAALDLAHPPVVVPARPDGQNVEFVYRAGPRHLVLRVYERGVGETRSCGTGIGAVAVAAASVDGVGADGAPWRVDVPGGTCEVVWTVEGDVLLSGPAVIVAEIELDPTWLANAR
jgi:diaminopimelate epimerase